MGAFGEGALMKTSSVKPPRTPSRFSASVHHQLNLYALAASAAGVSLLALEPPSEAKIVYTKTHQVIGVNTVYPLDLNNDGTIDFLIQQSGAAFSGTGPSGLFVKEAFGNAVAMGRYKYDAAALVKGALIGPQRVFTSTTFWRGEVMMQPRTNCSSAACSGEWQDVNNRYLGLKLRIDGKTRYGWARLSVHANGSQITGTLTGYAYETVPHKAIRAGQTHYSDEASARTRSAIGETAAIESAPGAEHPASLGRLALGAGARARRQP
jgi:hypothetical protein